MKLEAYCHINNKEISLNGEVLSKSGGSEDWFKTLYQNLNIDYPKFHKMDDLAKMAFLSSEYIKSKVKFDQCGDDEISLIFANSHSSHNTDLKFIESFQNGNPSPSLFVYTLPNILTGELAIRNKWYGENIFFILQKFDEQFFIEQIKLYFSKGSKMCLCGWVEAINDSKECFLFAVTNEEGNLAPEQLLKTYKGNE